MRRIAALVLSLAVFALAVPAGAQTTRLDGDVALASLMSISDAHLQKLADTMQLASESAAARSADWQRIRPLLERLSAMNVAAVLWYALPDGSYWTLQGGRQSASLRTRAYFSRLLSGRTVLGDLVVSKASKRATAIVAVPVVDGHAVTGVLGASVYLDKLGEQLRSEMQLPADAIFFSFDSQALVGLNWDERLIFLQPRTVSPELDRAFGTMLAHSSGIASYTFRGKARTVIYAKSPVTNWWYAFGFAEP